jgi:hypothetical protein
LKDEIQYHKDREFKVPLTLKRRQKQFQEFDDEQASFISYKLPAGDDEKPATALEQPFQQLSPRHPASRASTVFITQSPSEKLTDHSQSRKSFARRRTFNKLKGEDDSAQRLSPRLSPRTGVILLGGTMISDNKFCYDYSNQLEDIIKKNEMVNRFYVYYLLFYLSIPFLSFPSLFLFAERKEISNRINNFKTVVHSSVTKTETI